MCAEQGKLDVAQPQQLAARVYGMGCEGGSASACAEGGTLLLKDAGLFTRAREASGAAGSSAREQSLLARAVSLLDGGCRAGDAVDNAKCCGLLGALMLHERCEAVG